MSIKKESSGRRSVSVEVEVPGTPEQVWEAIATGPGITSWFVPSRIENGADGRPEKLICNFGPGMDSAATIKEWKPPHRLTAENAWYPEMPPVATEWIVEARDGGKCVVRVVHSLFADTDDWDNQLESTETGWPGFFRILRIYLTHFRGMPCSQVRAMGLAQNSVKEAWENLISPLGLGNVREGDKWAAPAGEAPTLSGTVESIGETDQARNLLLRVDRPAPGTASIGAFSCGPPGIQVMTTLYLYGDKAAEVAAKEEPVWCEWLGNKFPAPSGAGAES